MKILILFLNMVTIMIAQTNYENINKLISEGEYTKAAKLINAVIATEPISPEEVYELSFQKERLDRIKKDFRKSAEDVIEYINQYYPDASTEDLKLWEEDGTLEFKIIDGEKKYFNRSHANLFRVNKKAKQKKLEKLGSLKDDLDKFIEKDLPVVVPQIIKDGKFAEDVKIKIKYSLEVDADVIPEGEVIRCWMPYPIDIHERQRDVRLLDVNSDSYIISPDDYKHRSIYMEKETVNGHKTVFEFSAEYTAKAEKQKINPDNIKPYDTKSALYKNYTSERAPHIVFSDKIKKLSEEIVGDETNKYLIAKKIYKWINNNIPWAGAREYSTIRNISDYCISNGWGDCGIQTITFMTLARYNGIPVKWQSGWMLHPGNINLHDWAEMYFEGYGWLPVDQSFGLVDTVNEDIKWFFFGGVDSYHFIVNDDYSRTFFPAKIYPRSETVDFQRGEVEWRGGNLYFDKWDYHMKAEYTK